MKKYIVLESKYPVANEIHTPSYDLVNTDNPSERYMCAPNEFELNEMLNGSEFSLERREYSDEENSFSTVFAIKNSLQENYKNQNVAIIGNSVKSKSVRVSGMFKRVIDDLNEKHFDHAFDESDMTFSDLLYL